MSLSLLSPLLLAVAGVAASWRLAPDASVVSAFFLAVILAAGAQFMTRHTVILVGMGIYLVLALFYDPFFCYLPLLAWDFLVLGDSRGLPIRTAVSLAALTAVLAARGPALWPYPALFVLLGFLSALLLAWYQLRLGALQTLYYASIDDHTEYQLLLKEKNRTLLDKQNSEIYAATLKERNRIAREIHDNVGHLLSRSILMVGAARAVCKDDTLVSPLAQLEDSLGQAMTGIRTSVHDLYDDSLNLREAAGRLTSAFTFCPATLRYDMGEALPANIRYCFLSILKEALSNVARHSSATQVNILMREHAAMYQLTIEDNGKNPAPSFDAERLPSQGIGLASMRERVQGLGGNIHITFNRGFRIFILIPKP